MSTLFPQTVKTRASGSAEEHLGVLGPVLRALPGDTIEVVFKNNIPGRAINIEPTGMQMVSGQVRTVKILQL